MSEPNPSEDPGLPPDEAGGAFADALTFVRIAVTPIVMALVIWRWPDTQVATLATFLFIIAALTDIFDDFFGGSAKSTLRRYGYLDDVADTLLIMGTLAALCWVVFSNGMMGWGLAIPAAILILREVAIGLFKGYELTKFGWPDNLLSSAKGGFAVLGVSLLLASPWLTQWMDIYRAGTENAMEVFSNASPMIWILGQIALWIAAIFSLISGYKIFTTELGEEEPGGAEEGDAA